MPRQLTVEEIAFIRENTTVSVEEIVAKFPEADPKEITILYSHYKKTSNNIHNPNPLDKDAFIAGNLMAKRDGVVIMTQPASELGDARRKSRVKGEISEQYKDSIYVPHPKN